MDEEYRIKQEEKEIHRRTAPPGVVVYEAIYSEAEHELSRDSAGLAWSGLAAGLSMGFSMVVQAMLRVYLPEAEWQPLVSKLGYTVGFLIVILGRQQLFTENTLTPVLALLKHPSLSVFRNVARLWCVVLTTNLVGGLAFAYVVAHTELVDADVREVCSEIGHEALQYGFGTTLLRAIVAGWLIAMMVWLLPFAETARVWVILVISYLVGLGHFSHIIAGGIEVFYLVATSEISLLNCLLGYIVPTLLGNTLGGVALVAALAHAQFKLDGLGPRNLEK